MDWKQQDRGHAEPFSHFFQSQVAANKMVHGQTIGLSWHAPWVPKYTVMTSAADLEFPDHPGKKDVLA